MTFLHARLRRAFGPALIALLLIVALVPSSLAAPTATFAVSSWPAPTSVNPGQTDSLTVAATLTSSQRVAANIVLTVNDPTGNQVYADTWPGQRFQPGKTITQSASWVPPSTAMSGTYTVSVTIQSANGNSTYYNGPSVTTLSVGGAGATPTATTVASITPTGTAAAATSTATRTATPTSSPTPSRTGTPQPTATANRTATPTVTPTTGAGSSGPTSWGKVTIRGVNYYPIYDDWPSTGSVWSNVWTKWDWSRIQFEVNLAHGDNLNGFRMIGGAGAVASGAISQSTYVNEQTQLAGYLESLGMYYYPSCVASGATHMAVSGQTITSLTNTYANICAAVASALSSYPNVVGMDLQQEEATCWDGADPAGNFGTYDQCLSLAQAQYSAAKAAAPNLPIAFSESFNDTSDFPPSPSDSRYNDYWPINDYIDEHMYTGQMSSSSGFSYIQSQGKPIVAGEFGDTLSDYTTVQGSASTYHINVFAWAIVDDSDTTCDTCEGLYNRSGANPDQNLINALAAFPSSGSAP